MAKAIKVENLSKAYQLGDFGTGTISRDLERFWARLRGKEDPFLKIGEVNDRTTKGDSDIVWSLNNLSFDIEQGDAVGIIGRNGAGKSTLLKVLSRVTSPTTGSIKIKGRIASLLEVGTGFHPELTGKENIYLNGAILGMRKAEIKRKFDEIVDFAGVERYIDTPVKRYSSGMYVRLAFAVAAHLESEILIVDEVLAVGDAEFQKKCLGKMGDVSKGEGRTVLFVSHNMASIKSICNSAILLNNGSIAENGIVTDVINKYLRGNNTSDSQNLSFIGSLTKNIVFNKISVNNIAQSYLELFPSDAVTVKVEGECMSTIEKFRLSFSISGDDETRIFTIHDTDTPVKFETGKFISEFTIPAYFLRPGEYYISVGGHDGDHLRTGTDWIFGPNLIALKILSEYNLQNDFANVGLINVPFKAKSTHY
jgi:lipopolysaccharide transport system ATP-binding protein